jgi:hypothetical protein
MWRVGASLFLGDAFPTVEFVDCRKKFDLLSSFLQGNFIGLANRIQENLLSASN